MQALLDRFPSLASEARWQPLKQFLAVNPDVRRLNRAMGGRMLDSDPAASVTPRRVRPKTLTLLLNLRAAASPRAKPFDRCQKVRCFPTAIVVDLDHNNRVNGKDASRNHAAERI